ncbi:MAG: hypothetical protein QM484_06930 [Woeseiaceae bacterium]
MPKLVFHALDVKYIPENTTDIILGLQDLGFIGTKWNSPSVNFGERYLIGETFLSLVTFMGCAPAIELQPLDDNLTSTEFCHIEVEEIHREVIFVRGAEHLISRCPHCRHRHTDWQKIPESLIYACDKCHVESPLSEYDWKNNAGVGRFFINLHGIYPHEALPTTALINAFQKITGTAWGYFYMHKNTG